MSKFPLSKVLLYQYPEEMTPTLADKAWLVTVPDSEGQLEIKYGQLTLSRRGVFGFACSVGPDKGTIVVDTDSAEIMRKIHALAQSRPRYLRVAEAKARS